MNFQTLDQMLKVCFELTWQTSLQATVLIGLVMLTQVLFKRMLSPRWCYLFGLLVLLRLVVPVVPASPFSVFNLGKRISLNQPTLSDSVPVLLPQQSLQEAEVPVRVVRASSISAAIFAKYLWLVGCVGLLVAVARQHQKIARYVQRQPPVVDPEALALLENCRAVLGIKRHIKLVATDGFKTPALFGIWHPCLLVPAEILRNQERRELRLIFLHELIHLKNGDIALNWFMITVRSLHWFNPAVWLVCKRLRADQEMACDASVMSLLATDERRLYGHTLINMAEAVSTGKLCPALAPFISNNHIIRRRIIMISKFKPAGRLALMGTAALLIVLGSVTFTGASNGTPLAAQNEVVKQITEPSRNDFHSFEEELDSLDQRIQEKKGELDKLRAQLETSPDFLEKKNPFGTNFETAQMKDCASRELKAETQWGNERLLLDELKRIQTTNAGALRQAILRAQPDAILPALLQNYKEVQSKLIALQNNLGADNLDAQRIKKSTVELNTQIDDRVAGILEGMRVHVASLEAVMHNAEAMREKIRETEANKLNIPEAWWPYYKASGDLDRLKKFRDVLFLRLAQEKASAKAGHPDVGAIPR